MSTNIKFLEENYMISNKFRTNIDWKVLDDIHTIPKKYHGSNTYHL